MGISSLIPKSAKLSVIGGIFSADLGNPNAGEYDFIQLGITGGRTNVTVPLGMSMSPSYLYFFHKMNFSLSIDESVFLQAIKPGTIPELTIRDSSNGKDLFYAPMRLFRYLENQAIDSFHFNLNSNASFIGDFQAVLVQVADLVGVQTIYAQVSLDVYEITDSKYIEIYKRESGN
jgi:hypothetical protein